MFEGVQEYLGSSYSPPPFGRNCIFLDSYDTDFISVMKRRVTKIKLRKLTMNLNEKLYKP